MPPRERIPNSFQFVLYRNDPAASFFILNFFLIDYILSNGCARWGASGALFPKSALCGAEFPLEGLNLEAYMSI